MATNVGKNYYLKNDDGALVSDPSGKGGILTTFYQQLFTDPTPPDLQWIFDTWPKEELLELHPISPLVVRECIASFTKGKTCSEDEIVAEMLAELSEDIIDHICEAFSSRFLNTCGPSIDEIWSFIEANLLPKIRSPILAKQFRPIALLAVLQNREGSPRIQRSEV